jgi:hypothetical protein
MYNDETTDDFQFGLPTAATKTLLVSVLLAATPGTTASARPSAATVPGLLPGTVVVAAVATRATDLRTSITIAEYTQRSLRLRADNMR